MATEILKSFGTLQSELEQAKSSLRGVDEHIKRLIGRDPGQLVRPQGGKRGPQTQRLFKPPDADDPPQKIRRPLGSVFKRLSDPKPQAHHDEQELLLAQKHIISKVIVTPKEVPSRQEALAAQSSDEKFKARNRRMFGALLGTLQKFQQEETKLKSKEDKRAQVEKRIEEHEIREKAEIKKERQELFLNRKKKQAEIKMIELKMLRMKEYSTWEERQRPRQNYIRTKAKPNIYFLPRKLNDSSREALEASKSDIEKMIDKRRQEVFDELQHIEDRMKKNFERKPRPEDGEEVEDVKQEKFEDTSFPEVPTSEHIEQHPEAQKHLAEDVEKALPVKLEEETLQQQQQQQHKDEDEDGDGIGNGNGEVSAALVNVEEQCDTSSNNRIVKNGDSAEQ